MDTENENPPSMSGGKNENERKFIKNETNYFENERSKFGQIDMVILVKRNKS